MKNAFLTLMLVLSVFSVTAVASADSGGGWAPKPDIDENKPPVVTTSDSGGGW